MPPNVTTVRHPAAATVSGMHVLASIPSPTRSVWYLGPLPLRAYALCIIAGIVVAVWLTKRRWRERGGNPDHVWDVAGWAIVFGIIGGRLYHVVTDPELYFESGRPPGRRPQDLGRRAGHLGRHRAGDGRRVDRLPPPRHRPARVRRRRGARRGLRAGHRAAGQLVQQRALRRADHGCRGGCRSTAWTSTARRRVGLPCRQCQHDLGYFQPTFLYELVWDVLVGVALILIDRRLRLGRGNVMALYVMGYTFGRGCIEVLRTDDANHILGVRLNVWTAIIVFLLGLAYFLRHGGFHAEREASPYPAGRDEPAEPDAAESSPGAESTQTEPIKTEPTETGSKPS